MENQDQYIPEHLSQRWEAVSRELGVASVELVEANRKYNEAIMARLAISQELKDWQMKTYFNQ